MEELYRQYSQIVFYFLYTRCKDSLLAEDLMQETFLKAIEYIDSYNGSCKISTWLCQIAKHLLYQHWQKSGRIQFEETDDTLKAADNTETQAIARMELTDVWDKLLNLPSDMKSVVEFRVLGNFSYKEIERCLAKAKTGPELLFTVPN